MKIILLLISLGLFFSSFANAEPSMDETWNYIHADNLKVEKEYKEYYESKFKQKTGDNYRLSLNKDSCKLYKHEGHRTMTFPLIMADPSTIKITQSSDGKSFWVYCKNDEKCIQTKYLDNGAMNSSSYFVITSNKRTKMMKAVSHLIKLCGGTGELF